MWLRSLASIRSLQMHRPLPVHESLSLQGRLTHVRFFAQIYVRNNLCYAWEINGQLQRGFIRQIRRSGIPAVGTDENSPNREEHTADSKKRLTQKVCFRELRQVGTGWLARA